MKALGRRARATSVGWDDGDAAAFGAELAALVHADDLSTDEPLALASRSAVLSSFAEAGLPGARQAPVAPARRQPRLAWILATAAVLGLLAIGGAAGLAPGRPLYEVRVAAEAIALPGDPVDRERAQADRLAARILDAAEASRVRDAEGARAGLEAFARIAAEATTAAVPDEVAASRVASLLTRMADIPAAGPDAAATLERARVAGVALLDALQEPHVQPVPSAAPSPTVGPTATWSPTLGATPRRSGAPDNGGNQAGPSPTTGPRPTATPRAGGQEASPGPNHGAGPAPSPTTSASAGSGGSSGANAGASGASGAIGSGSGSGGPGNGHGGSNP